MSKKNPEERRRKKKLAEQKRKARQTESLAYLGEKYKKDKFVPTWMHTEIGIYQTYVVTGRKIFDQTVASALESLIRKMRKGALPPLPEGSDIHYEVGREEDLLVENVRRCWRDHFATEWRPPNDDLIGVLRTILGSIEKVKSPGPQSQSYLRHIAGFLTKKLGVSVKGFSADRKPLPEPDEDELLQLGRRWHAGGDQEIRTEFLELASHLMKSGQAGRVIDACHLLAGEISDPESETVNELISLIHQARESLVTAMG
jgi:hypothetical protein